MKWACKSTRPIPSAILVPSILRVAFLALSFTLSNALRETSMSCMRKRGSLMRGSKLNTASRASERFPKFANSTALFSSSLTDMAIPIPHSKSVPDSHGLVSEYFEDEKEIQWVAPKPVPPCLRAVRDEISIAVANYHPVRFLHLPLAPPHIAPQRCPAHAKRNVR